MADIFISYSKKDAERARQLVQHLSAQGWSVFWDRNVPPGKQWREVLEAELMPAACVIVLWSKNSIGSSWVDEEAQEGRKRDVLIPVRLDPVEPPFGYKNIQACDLTGWHGEVGSPALQALIAAVRNLLRNRRSASVEVPTFRGIFSSAPARKVVRAIDLKSVPSPYRIMKIDWQVNALRLIEQDEEYQGDGRLTSRSLREYIERLELQKADEQGRALWRRGSSADAEGIDEQLTEAREILNDLEDVGADAVDHLPKHMKDFADYLRRLVVEMLVQDDTQADMEITQQIIDHARARYSRLPERTPSQQQRKSSALAAIAELARKLGFRDR